MTDGIWQMVIQIIHGEIEFGEERVQKDSALDPSIWSSQITGIPGTPPPHRRVYEDPDVDGDSREYLLGSSAAFINILFTYPVYKVQFRQQLSGLTVGSSVRQLHGEGLLMLWRGVQPPLIQRSLNMGIMFGMYDQSKRLIRRHYPHCPPGFYRPASAMLAGCVEAVLTPLERVQTLLQDPRYNERLRGTYDAFAKLRAYGVAEYYRGLSVILLRNGPCNAVFFGLRHPVKNAMPATTHPLLTLAEHFASGALLGTFISTVFYPLQVVKTRMQAKLGGEFLSIAQAVAAVYRERGHSVRRMLMGVHMNYARSILSWGMVNVTYEILRKLVYPC
ncbi:PREDICTED: solute carrier family 25 member 51-like [Priapulus caudatus]|uniref:Solute carrier family 25 member 51-like n=1 Tax=Priapulus caudatus TaxID=37621 RepID=A0ABM1EGS9_PRICU|nr:PREDICTED: solute carrier family 25 member 51-like [Priapulus caudatus]XP_014671399.1 PREDICTED: solute carrier family 25 member 51-like [Priapulus caudatus]XP_014671400.1 PREDICTED: solute carrier family 25 member 51-like [Priapulus caudatus]